MTKQCWKKSLERKDWTVFEDRWGGNVDIKKVGKKWEFTINKGLDGTYKFKEKNKAIKTAKKYMKDNC